MTTTKPTMKMPELPVFARSLTTGFIGAEVWRITFYLGANFATILPDVAIWAKASWIAAGLLLCLTYAVQRGAHVAAVRMGRSFRLDLLAAISIGIWINQLVSPWLATVHTTLKNADPHWALAVFILLCAVLLSPLIQQYWPKPKGTAPQLYFIADEEIDDEKDDLLASESQAKSFAETVLASGAHPGLVFGVDGPWGLEKQASSTLLRVTGKTQKTEPLFVDSNPFGTHQNPTLRTA